MASIRKDGFNVSGGSIDKEQCEKNPGTVKQNPSLVLVGSSHKSAPLNLLASISLDDEQISKILPALKEQFQLLEIVLLSTCNRTEIYAVVPQLETTEKKLHKWLHDRSSAKNSLDEGQIYLKKGTDAVTHLLQVNCGLDSLILGESEITGQVQKAFELSKAVGTVGSYLMQLFSVAFRVSKRARSETKINAGTTSVASAAVHLAKRVYSDLTRRRVLVIGAGDTGALVARHLATHRPKTLYLTNRTYARAETLAGEVDAIALEFDKWRNMLVDLDVVVCATKSQVPLISKQTIVDSVGSKAKRPLLLIDISLPHNVDGATSELENVYLHDMNDLSSIVKNSLTKRAKEIPSVKKIIDTERNKFFSQLEVQNVGPVIRDLRGQFEQVRKREVERLISKFSEEDQPLAERLTRDLVNKLLHTPTIALRTLGDESELSRDRLVWVRRLFGLDQRKKD